MSRKFIDCREHPQSGDKQCTIAIAADTEEEVLDAAMQHATAVHGYEDTPEVRSEVRKFVKEGPVVG